MFTKGRSWQKDRHPRRPRRAVGPEAWLLAIIAAVLFFIAFLLGITGTATDAVFAPTSLTLLGLALLALHVAGIGTGWTVSRRRR